MELRINKIENGYGKKIRAAMAENFNIWGSHFSSYAPENVGLFFKNDKPGRVRTFESVKDEHDLSVLIGLVASDLYTGIRVENAVWDMKRAAEAIPLTPPPVPQNRITLKVNSVSKEYEGKVKAAMKSVFNEPPMTSGDYFVFGRADKQKIDMDFSEVKDEHDFESLIVHVADRLYKGEEFHFILKEMRHRASKVEMDSLAKEAATPKKQKNMTVKVSTSPHLRPMVEATFLNCAKLTGRDGGVLVYTFPFPGKHGDMFFPLIWEEDIKEMINAIADASPYTGAEKGNFLEDTLEALGTYKRFNIPGNQLTKYQQEAIEKIKGEGRHMTIKEAKDIFPPEPYRSINKLIAREEFSKRDLAFMAPYNGQGKDGMPRYFIGLDPCTEGKNISSSNNNNYADLSTEAPRVVKGARRTAHPIYGGFCEARVPDRQARNPKGAHQDGSGTGTGEIQKPGVPF